MTAGLPTVGVDVGGTKIAVGLVTASGEVQTSVSRPTPPDGRAIPTVIAELVDQVRPESGVEAVGIGAAGFVSSDRSTMVFSPNISWIDEPVGDQVAALVGVPVVVENDANAAAWAEFRFGAGVDVDDLLLVTIGTGVGGGVVQDGALMRGAFGGAAEIGHIRVVPDGLPCGCGQRGCFEQYASGSALVRQARERLGSEADDLTGPRITELARQGDPVAQELIADLGRWAGEGIATLAAVLDPKVVVIGGGVGEAGDLLLKPLATAFREHLTGADHRPAIDVVPAQMGNRAGMVGAADLARVRTHG